MAIAEGFCSFQCHLYRKWNRYFYIHRDIYKSQPWRNWEETCGHGPVTTFGGSSIASQSRINRGSIADLSITKETRSTKRLTLQMLCLSWEVIWLSIKKETVIDRAKPSTQDCSILQIWTAILQRMSFPHIHNRWLHQSHTNRRSIAMQRFTIADVKIWRPIHNS